MKIEYLIYRWKPFLVDKMKLLGQTRTKHHRIKRMKHHTQKLRILLCFLIRCYDLKCKLNCTWEANQSSETPLQEPQTTVGERSACISAFEEHRAIFSPSLRHLFKTSLCCSSLLLFKINSIIFLSFFINFCSQKSYIEERASGAPRPFVPVSLLSSTQKATPCRTNAFITSFDSFNLETQHKLNLFRNFFSTFSRVRV